LKKKLDDILGSRKITTQPTLFLFYKWVKLSMAWMKYFVYFVKTKSLQVKQFKQVIGFHLTLSKSSIWFRIGNTFIGIDYVGVLSPLCSECTQAVSPTKSGFWNARVNNSKRKSNEFVCRSNIEISSKGAQLLQLHILVVKSLVVLRKCLISAWFCKNFRVNLTTT